VGIERGNSKHGIRMDDEMAHEMRAAHGAPNDGLIQESIDVEPLGDDQPIDETTLLADSDPQDHDALSRFAGFLRRSAFPADAHALLAEARRNNAPDDVIAALDDIPATSTYENTAEVWAAVTGVAVPRAGKRF
jgi:hypothetical protein